jgi:predicted dehydrogenase
MIRIGVVNIDVSHPKVWARLLKEEDRARYVAVYNDGFREDDEVEAFVKKNGLEARCKSVSELADMVDIVFVQGCNWNKHLDYAKEALSRGKPVLIDKPMAGSIADCRELEKLVADGNVILGSSSARYAPEIQEFLAKPRAERGDIMHVYGTAGVDEFNYAVHIVEAIGGLMGSGAEAVRFTGRASKDGKTSETFYVSFGQSAGATYTTFDGLWMPFHVVIFTTTGAHYFMIDTGSIYKALLDRICDYMETRTNRLAPIEALTESIKIMLAGRLSRERDGETVRLADIPADDPGFDGDLFEKGYAAKAKKIYLD